MYRNLSHMQMLHKINSDKDGLDNPKKHRKAENIWLKGHLMPERSPDLQGVPSHEALVRAWQSGLKECQSTLWKIGTCPATDEESNPTNN